MPQLPPRPDLDQLRRRARELQRAAAAGDPLARDRLARLGLTPTLAAAQLAVAREHGMASWAALRAEVSRRRSAAQAPGSATRTADAAPEEGSEPRSRRGVGDRAVAGEPLGGPDLLTADGVALIDGQYRDRGHLRPILDAVIARLSEVGEVTVQVRKTCVSLRSPRRTFAALQPTTRTRVDLGLRLVGSTPRGRLLPARSVANGAITARIALSSPADVDDEVIAWLRRAHAENGAAGRVAPSAGRGRPGATSLGWISVAIEGHDLPGVQCRPQPGGSLHEHVHVALCSREREGQALAIVPRRGEWRAVHPVLGDAASARWALRVSVRRDERGLDFGGPSVRGNRDDRHLGLVWGEVHGDGTLRLFRGAKLLLADVDPILVDQALAGRGSLLARLGLTDARGNPRCARVRPPHVAWSLDRG